MEVAIFSQDSHQLGHDTTSGLDTESQWANVDQKNTAGVLVAGKDTTLDGSTIRNGLVRVDTLRRFLAAKVLLEELLYLWNTGGTTDKDNLVAKSASAFRCIRSSQRSDSRHQCPPS